MLIFNAYEERKKIIQQKEILCFGYPNAACIPATIFMADSIVKRSGRAFLSWQFYVLIPGNTTYFLRWVLRALLYFSCFK